MPISTLTAKGQTTIPKAVRESLQLKPKDKLLYVIDGGRMIVQPVHGGISRLKGIFRDAVKGPIDFKKLREETKRLVAARVLRGMR